MNIRQDNEDIGYLFNVDILIKNQSNAIALQLLIEMMNQSEHILDFRVKSGMKLGGIIDTLLEIKNNPPTTQTNIPNSTASNHNKIGKGEKSVSQSRVVKPIIQRSTPKLISPNTKPIEDPRNWIRSCIIDNRLVRLTANRQGQHFNIPCRILNFDEEKQYINIYHVDEKQVYSFNLNEIDSFDS
ncbi:hypothetical protein ACP8HI_02605 [Paenibacillus sp. FA6]|uniref:hypothetical protein n=1 Tax=Paenibacillus sp. FA6 TaxID=3413029 RepID=UPI003F65C595